MHVIYLPCITVVVRTCSTIFMTNENGYFFLVPNFTNKLFDQHIIYLGEHSMCTLRAVAKSCLTLFDPMNCRMLGFLILHYLPQFAQTHVHWVGDAIQPPHPPLTLSSAPSLSKHQGLFQWVGSSHQVAKVLELKHQHQTFQWIFKVDLFYD